ncbi:MFS transporter [Ramlibacter rhizophilus]|uniref:MFS transporter n=1 Tax=Ramlibacter rhizophilus TaxID=1781167 RepID=A0A4Z0BD93_9BURK|nr:MFS transporter [Ramlibacter rhizophilus]TFY96433.1 MFS transporter [Ramlibacter rhizophilus]
MPAASPPAPGLRQLAPFAGLSASYFAHIGFFNPYLPLWLKHLGLPVTVISVLIATQSFTRVFAPYAWGMLSDRTGERVRLLRLSGLVAVIASLGLWWSGGPVWIGLVLLVMFTHTSSMMSLTEAAMAQLVAGDWGRYGRVRLWGSVGFMATVVVAGAWFERFGMEHFPGWTLFTLVLVLGCTLWLPDVREAPAPAGHRHEAILPVLREPAVRWFFASLLFHITAHFAVYGFISLYLDARGYSKAMIGGLWAVSVAVEILWFFWQGRLIGHLSMPRWLVVCGAATALRMALLATAADWLAALVVAQVLHALSFATHHTAAIAMVTRHFPGRLRGRGQALFTVVGYGVGGVTGVLAGGQVVARFGYVPMYAAATVLGMAATYCAWRVLKLESAAAANP